MSFSPEQCVSDIEKHLAVFSDLLARFSIDINPLRDHVGYRCSTSESYKDKVLALNKIATFVREIRLSNRRISVFQLDSPVRDFISFAIQEPRSDEPQWEIVEHLGYVVEKLATVRKLLRNIPDIRIMPIFHIGEANYFKIHTQGTEIEFRDLPILAG